MNNDYSAIKNSLLKKHPQLKVLQRKKILAFVIKLLVLEVAVIALMLYLASYTPMAVVLGIYFFAVVLLTAFRSSKLFKKQPFGRITHIVTVIKQEGLVTPMAGVRDEKRKEAL